jgi:acylphosphatase
MKKGLFVKIYGLVQGVGLRYFIKSKAEEMRISGYVYNQSDGTVEIEAEGEEEKLKKLLELVQQGTWWSEIDKIDVKWLDDSKRFKGFDIKY